jgi:hypothetical protein
VPVLNYVVYPIQTLVVQVVTLCSP